jgi:hypothetical protein
MGGDSGEVLRSESEPCPMPGQNVPDFCPLFRPSNLASPIRLNDSPHRLTDPPRRATDLTGRPHLLTNPLTHRLTKLTDPLHRPHRPALPNPPPHITTRPVSCHHTTTYSSWTPHNPRCTDLYAPITNMIPSTRLTTKEFARRFPPGGKPNPHPPKSPPAKASSKDGKKNDTTPMEIPNHAILNDVPVVATSFLVDYKELHTHAGDSTYPIPPAENFPALRPLESRPAVFK